MRTNLERNIVRWVGAILVITVPAGGTIIKEYFDHLEENINNIKQIQTETNTRIQIEENRSKRADNAHSKNGENIGRINQIRDNQKQYKEWLLMLTKEAKEDRYFMHKIDKKTGENAAIIVERHR